MDLRSAPIMTLSLATSKSNMCTALRLKRAAVRAASLTMLARSAPEKPGVPRARMFRLTSSAIGTFFAATDVGTVHDHAAIEAAGTQQRRIEYVGAVGRGDQDHAIVGLKAVHLD